MRQVKLLAYLLAAHAAALALFTGGFFLTRFEVADVSTCASKPHSGDHSAPSSTRLRRSAEHAESNESDECWMPRRYARVVFVVVDALRYDFVASTDGNNDGRKDAAHRSAGRAFFTNQLPALRDACAQRPRNALLLKFVADPPTMTMQRLKGLTTGSLPTFLDIKDNMASAEIAEDNLLRQMRAQRRGVVFMGDDTWEGLYAKELTRAYAFDSFNVKDLHSVDRGVAHHLFPELRRADWGLLIAHLLGVDHVGHTHGPSSPFMAAKLRETNALLERLIAEVDAMDDTLLAVLGDHGMSADGNHGGASDDETGAALFLFSSQPLVRDAEDADSDNTDGGLVWPTEVPQVDLVPTLTLLSGLPIPFGNLGSVIPQLFFTAGDSAGDGDGRLAAFRNLNQALALNVEQVRRYLLRYSRASKLPEREFDTLERIYREVAQLKAELQAASENDDADSGDEEALHAKLATLQQAFLREALALGRSIWTQFDLCNMGWGVVFLLWLLGLLTFGGVLAPSKRSAGDDHFPLVWSAIGALVGALFPALDVLVPVLPSAATSRAVVVSLLFGLADATRRLRLPRLSSGSMVVAVTTNVDASTVVAATVVLLRLLGLLSNSYIVAEDKVTAFLAVTTGVVQLVRAQRAATVASCLVLLVSTRLASALEPPNIIQSDVTLLRTLLPLLATVALAAVTTTAVSTGASPLAALVRVRSLFAALVASCTSCAVYWCLSPSESPLVRLWLPRGVLLAALGALGVQLRSVMTRPPASQLHIVVSGEYVLTAFLVVPAFMLVLGPASPLPVLLLVLQTLSFAAVAVLGVELPGERASVAQTLLWSVVCGHSFFFTGHQNTFTSLQNAAGFVGLDAFYFYGAGALLGLNTFGSYLLWLLFLPLALARPRATAAAAGDRAGALVVARACWRRAALTVTLFFALNASVSTAFVALQRRHLMVWAIFAPKFIFDAAALLLVELLLLLVTHLL
ncbi:hypothetical protein PybrP1_003939 [[Pythium] brassicae (nom. inval.)]|nr:hypothetical protein PybrP1_003939 [[Pythium] brassicae (nom. inval.)]